MPDFSGVPVQTQASVFDPVATLPRLERTVPTPPGKVPSSRSGLRYPAAMAAVPGSTPPSLHTSLCIERACAGDVPSLGQMVERITPRLLAPARARLRQPLRGVEPEDLVQDTWAHALPKLRDLTPRDGKWTPMLLRFLSVILLRRLNDQLRALLRHRGGDVGRGGEVASQVDPLQGLPAEVSGVVTRLVRAQQRCVVQQALAELPDDERQVVVLRGIEQLPNGEVARLLGIDDSSVTRRFQKAIERLRVRLPGSVFEELE
jgi:RNA polymerase sigma factor (sigma-70 family)